MAANAAVGHALVRSQLVIEKARGRAAGIPRSFTELHRSLALLARFRELGWHRSVAEGAPVARNGSALAFFNYPALFWLGPLLRSTDTVFEYGSGNSTRWFADRVSRVVAVEHDPVWFDRVRCSIPANAEVSLRTSAYADAITEASLDKFDIVLIDGPERRACARRAIEHVAEDGLILFDNSDRPQNAAALVELGAQGFSRIDLAGPMPGYADLSCTSACFRNSGRWTRPTAPPPYLGGFIPPPASPRQER
jgi:hypothetical protein